MLQGRLVAFAREHGVATRQNPRLTLEDCKGQQEPDVVFYSAMAPAQETDVTVVNPCAWSYIAKTAKDTRKVAKLAHAKKCSTYEEQAKERQHSFTPLVFETHGKMLDEVRKLIKSFAASTSGSSGLAVQSMVLDLAVTLVRGNALCARSAISKSQRHQDVIRGARGS